MKSEQPWKYNAATLWINYVDIILNIIPHQVICVRRCAVAVD